MFSGMTHLVGKMVSFDCKCVPNVGGLGRLFSFGKQCGTKAGEWIQWLINIIYPVLLF
jgi:hypothetical protein